MFKSNQDSASDFEFFASFSDGDGYISHTTDYLSTEEEMCSTCENPSPKNRADVPTSPQLDDCRSDQVGNVPSSAPFGDSSISAHYGGLASSVHYGGLASSAHYGDFPRSAQVGDSPSSVSGTFIHLANGSVLCDLGGGSPPRKKVKVDSLPVKRSNHPKETTDYLKEWMKQHLEHPYPTEEEKKELARDTGLTLKQVNDWCINFRRRQLDEMCRKYGVDPKVSKRNRRGSKRSQSSPKSEDKENVNPFPVPDAGLNQQDQYGRYPRVSKHNRRSSDLSRPSSICESKANDVPFSVPDAVLNQKHVTNLYMFVEVACLQRLYQQSEKRFQEERLPRDEWIQKMYNHVICM